MPTIKEIAEKSGVSRGTVDRVLHDRGRVSKEVKERVLAVAEFLDYEPNRAGLILASRKRQKKVGALCPSLGNAFFDEVIDGMRKAEEEFKDLGFSLVIKEVKGYEPAVHIEALNALEKEKVCGLAVASIEDKEVINRLDELDLPVIAFNSDLECKTKLCYVGSEYKEKGKINADLLKLAKPEGAKTVIIKGSESMRGHNEVVSAFLEELEDYSLNLISVLDSYDDDDTAFKVLNKTLDEHPEVDAVFISTAGVEGCMKALGERKPLVFTSDDTPLIKEYIKEGRILWTVCQSPFEQGYQAVKKLFDYLIDGLKPENFIASHVIKLKANIS